MSNVTAEALAKDILDGTYTPSEFVDCQPELPIDHNPHVIRYTQFILFRNPTLDPRSPKEPGYMILQQYRLFSPDPNPDTKPIENELIRPMAKALSRDILSIPLPGAEGVSEPRRLPNPNEPRLDIDRLRLIALERQIPGYQPNVTDEELRSLYKDWHNELIRERLLDATESLERAGFDFDEELTRGVGNLSDILNDILKKVLLPTPYQPFKNPYPHFAWCAVFEQTWQLKGYTRGELINTISLAPGEQLTLEIHSWDKSTIKSEEELATESELRVSENLTERDVRTVVRNITTDLNVTAYIPLEGGGSVTPTGDINNNLQQTLDQTRERTVQASNSLKTTRKLRIEVSREIGREQKQTHVIANTNRCHTLNCHYFEVMSNYLVTTQLESVRPCLLLPNPNFEITAAWVLCHEDVLKQALLDKIYLPGFQAAKTLETHVAFLELKKEEATTQGDIPDPLREEMQRHVEAIVKAHDNLISPAKVVKKAAKSQECKLAKRYGGHLAWAACVAAKCGVKVLRRLLYWAMLQANVPAVNALEKLKNERDQPNEALRNFFATVTPRDYQYSAVNAAVAKGLDALGLPKDLVSAFIQWGLFSYVDYAADDGGLYNAVAAAASRLEEIWELPPATEPGVVKEGFSTMEVAQAKVGFEQLKCHIEDNWLHYLQAIWLRESANQRFLRLQEYGLIAAILDNEVLGFLGHKAAYPINDLEAVKRWLDFAEMKKTISIPPGEPQLVTLPTQGTMLEAIVGQCDACEDFIQQSRVLDLRTQEAKTRQEESEANRYEKRVENGEYADPRALTAGKVVINIDGDQTPPPG